MFLFLALFLYRLNAQGLLFRDRGKYAELIQQIYDIFPCHITVDENFRIVSFGADISICVPSLEVGRNIADFFQIFEPNDFQGRRRIPQPAVQSCSWTWSDIADLKTITLCCASSAARRDSSSPALTPTTGEGSQSPSPGQLFTGKVVTIKGPEHGNSPPTAVLFLLKPNEVAAKFVLSSRRSSRLASPAAALSQSAAAVMRRMDSSSGNISLSPQTSRLLKSKLTEAEERIQSLQAQLAAAERSLEMKRMFVRYVSHEIRTPLNTVAMGLKLMHLLMRQEEEEKSKLQLAIKDKETKAGKLLSSGGGSKAPSFASCTDETVTPTLTIPSKASGQALIDLVEAGADDSTPRPQNNTSSSTNEKGGGDHENKEDFVGMVGEIMDSCDVAINILNDLLLYEKIDGGILELDTREEPALSLIYEVS